MTTRRPRGLRPVEILTVVLVATCTGLAAWNLWQIARPPRDVNRHAGPPDQEDVRDKEADYAEEEFPVSDQAPRDPGGGDTVIVERVLFNAGREPVPVEDESVERLRATAATPPPPMEVTLESVLISGSERRAFATLGRNGRSVWMAPGDRFEGWVVQSIEPKAVLLRHTDSGRTQRIELFPSLPGVESGNGVRSGHQTVRGGTDGSGLYQPARDADDPDDGRE